VHAGKLHGKIDASLQKRILSSFPDGKTEMQSLHAVFSPLGTQPLIRSGPHVQKSLLRTLYVIDKPSDFVKDRRI
jgi:hypothetical protein